MPLRKGYEGPVCPHVNDCAHPKGGEAGDNGACLDCGHQVVPPPRDRDMPIRRHGECIALTAIQYEGKADADA